MPHGLCQGQLLQSERRKKNEDGSKTHCPTLFLSHLPSPHPLPVRRVRIQHHQKCRGRHGSCVSCLGQGPSHFGFSGSHPTLSLPHPSCALTNSLRPCCHSKGTASFINGLLKVGLGSLYLCRLLKLWIEMLPSQHRLACGVAGSRAADTFGALVGHDVRAAQVAGHAAVALQVSP
jgi:hypothetical protein